MPESETANDPIGWTSAKNARRTLACLYSPFDLSEKYPTVECHFCWFGTSLVQFFFLHSEPFMNPSTDLSSFIVTSAEMRVLGKSWESIALLVGEDVKTCQNWPRLYPDIWQQAYRLAEMQSIHDGANESLLEMRRRLRSEDKEEAFEAAEILFKAQIDLLKHTSKAVEPPALQSPLLPLYDYLASLSHEDRRHLLDDLLASERRIDSLPTVVRENSPGAA